MLKRQRSSLVNIIKQYFERNFTHEEILSLLSKEQKITISLSTLKRHLRFLRLKGKKVVESGLKDIVAAVMEELHSCGYNLGYKALWLKLMNQYHLKLKRETVYKILQVADPEGIANRFGNKLRRRQYLSPGPNYVWHTDCYDKLKQFGFAIHAYIDGFSRKLLWLETTITNNDPKVIAFYYLTTVKRLQCLPSLMRSDKGSENSLIECLQMALRHDHKDELSAENSFITSKSVRNQRIESFWGQLRRHSMDFWIQFFKTMQKENFFDGSDLQIKSLQYCFGPLIKYDLLKAKELWNHHCIRKQAARNNLCGKPYFLFHCPEKFDSEDYKKPVDINVIDDLIENFAVQPTFMDPMFKELGDILLPDAFVASTPKEGLIMYKQILDLLREHRSSNV